MSLIVGQYYRGTTKQRPKQWGSLHAVQSEVFKNAENLGIDPSIISFVLPCWGPGDQHSLGNIHRIGQNTGVTYNGGGLYFQKDGKYVTFANDGKLEYDRITVLSYGMHIGTPTYEHRVMSMDNISTSQRSWQLDLASSTSNTNPRFLIFSSGATKSANVSTSVTINTPHLIGGSFGDGKIKCYYDDKIATTSYSGSIDKTGSPLFLGVSGSDLYRKFYGYLYWCLMLSDVVPDNIIIKLYEHPYFLFQPPTFRTYFDLAESGLISGSVTDSFNMSDSVVKRAILSAVAQESMSLADTDQNLGNFIVALVDQIELSSATGRIAILNVSSNDSFRISDAVSSVQNIIAIISDDFHIYETPSVRYDMAATVQDIIEFSESFVATLQATAVINEIINLSDTVSTDALSILSALAADVFSVSDGANARACFVSAVLENITLSEGATNFLAALAAASETINISDLAFWQGIQYAFATDDIAITSTAVSLLAALATSAESIRIDDSCAVTATFSVEINDVVQFAETISAIASLRASLHDGINITATTLEISTLPNGKVSVSFSLRTPGVDFEMRTTTIVFNLK